jgi:hypothetical protein
MTDEPCGVCVDCEFYLGTIGHASACEGWKVTDMTVTHTSVVNLHENIQAEKDSDVHASDRGAREGGPASGD